MQMYVPRDLTLRFHNTKHSLPRDLPARSVTTKLARYLCVNHSPSSAMFGARFWMH